MKKLLGVFFSLLVVILVACQQTKEPLNFIGESENWIAKLDLETQNNESEIKNFELKYKGKDSKDVKNLEFKIKAPNYSLGMGDIELQKNGSFKDNEIHHIKQSTTSSDVMNIEVKWNGKVENFSLENNK